MSQTITAGAAASLTVTQQPVPGAASGNAFATQPAITLKDQYGNTCANGPSAAANVTAAAKAGTGAWTIGGTVTKAASAGVAAFTDLTCTLTTPGNGAITFTSGLITVDSNTFNIPQNPAKVLTADTTDNDADHDMEITFGADANFTTAITGVSFNGNALTSNQYTVDTVNKNKITLHPGSSDNTYLRTPATGNVVITAAGYNDSSVSQTIKHGDAVSMAVTTDITAPTLNGGQFARQPEVTLKDQYGNPCTSNSTAQVTVSKKDAGGWTLTGTTTLTVGNGVAVFTNLGATNTSQITGAKLAFNSTGLAEVTSTVVTLPAPGGSGGGGSGGGSSGSSTPSALIETLVNGEKDTVATATTTREGDKTVLTVTLDDEKVDEKLEKEGSNTVITIGVKNDSDIVAGQLNGQTVKNMETKDAVLEIRTENVTYIIPASQINIDKVSEQIGEQVELKDITVNVKISVPSQENIRILEDTANKGNYNIIVPPVEFTITCTSGGKTVEVTRFNSYVERLVAIPEGIDPDRVTTGIVLNPDGTFSHVPTAIIIIDGKYYAKINSLTNSIYSVIWNPKNFRDTENHWAKEAINDMGSRMIVGGNGNDNYEPDRHITRAEFTAVIVRALGLMRPGTGKNVFNDVEKGAWYYDAVSIAYEYGIVSGSGSGKFNPLDKITREQAMAMVSRTMKIIGLKVELSENEVKELLDAFKDSGSITDFAKNGAAACIETGIITGRMNNLIAPKEYMTRAETAVAVRRLLEKSGII